MAKLKITKEEVVDILKKRWWIILIEVAVLAAILVIDLVSKKYLLEFLKGQPSLHYVLIPGFIDLRYSENTGAGFGLFKGNTTALIVITMIVMIGIFAYLVWAQKENMWLRISLIFVLGGGIGNLVDRLALGYVRDFFEFTFIDFAIFNLADSFVTVGAIMLIIVLIVMLIGERKKSQKEFEQKQSEQPEHKDAVHPLDMPPAINDFLDGGAETEIVVSDGENASNDAENDIKRDDAASFKIEEKSDDSDKEL